MPAKISNREIIAKVAMALFLYGALLFGSAGTLDWPEAWLFLIVYSAWAIPVVAWLKKNNPGLLEERMAFLKKSAKGWDRTTMLLGTILFIAMFSIAGLDAVRYLGFIPSFSLIFLVMRENTYLSRIVEIQKPKSHHYRSLQVRSPPDVCGSHYSLLLHPSRPRLTLRPHYSPIFSNPRHYSHIS